MVLLCLKSHRCLGTQRSLRRRHLPLPTRNSGTRLPDRDRQTLEPCLRNVVVILSPQAANVDSRPRRFRKAVEDVWNHLGTQISDLLARERQFDDCVGTVGEVDNAQTKGLVQWDVGGSVAGEPDWSAESGLECCAQGDGDVFCGMVVVNCMSVRYIRPDSN